MRAIPILDKHMDGQQLQGRNHHRHLPFGCPFSSEHLGRRTGLLFDLVSTGPMCDVAHFMLIRVLFIAFSLQRIFLRSVIFVNNTSNKQTKHWEASPWTTRSHLSSFSLSLLVCLRPPPNRILARFGFIRREVERTT